MDKTSSNNEETKNEIQKTFGNLPKLMSLPRQPVSVMWQCNEDQKRGDGILSALLKFSDDDYAFILENSQSYDQKINAKMLSEHFNQWLPDDAKKDITVQPYGEGLYELTGIFGKKPNLFTETQLSPYIHGGIIPLHHGYIYISLYSM